MSSIYINYIILAAAIAVIVIDAFVLAVSDYKNRRMEPVLKPYPPSYEGKELTPYDVGAVFNIGTDTRAGDDMNGMEDIIASMIVQLSIEGYVKICKDRYEVLRPYTGHDENLQKIFNRLMSYGDPVYIEDLSYSDFYADILPLYQKWFMKADIKSHSLQVIPLLLSLLSMGLLFISGKTVYSILDTTAFDIMGLEMIAFIMSFADLMLSIITACRAVTCDLRYRMLLAKIRGYREFLSTSQKNQLMALYSEDLKYITKTVPYACALGLTPAFTEKLKEVFRGSSGNKIKIYRDYVEGNEFEKIAEKYLEKQ